MRDLYPARIARLVDGGVHDNQGIAALLAEECTVFLVSDASGQLRALDEPDGGLVGVLRRADDILQERLRETQLADLQGRRNAGVLHGLMFVHLTSDLDQRTVTTKEAVKKPQPADPDKATTRYNVRKDIQKKLSEIRTDLDSFTTAEAYALMASGYLMTSDSLARGALPTLIKQDPSVVYAEPWPFLSIQGALEGNHDTEHLGELLDDSKNLAFKVWDQAPELIAIRPALKPIAGGVLLIAAWWLWRRTVTLAALLGAGGLLTLLAAFRGKKGLKSKKSMEERLIGLLAMSIGWLASLIHLRWFDPWFQRIGRWPPPKK